MTSTDLAPPTDGQGNILDYDDWTTSQLLRRAYEEGIDGTGLDRLDLIVLLQDRDLSRADYPYEV